LEDGWVVQGLKSQLQKYGLFRTTALCGKRRGCSHEISADDTSQVFSADPVWSQVVEKEEAFRVWRLKKYLGENADF
jgi:hypothetical protein